MRRHSNPRTDPVHAAGYIAAEGILTGVVALFTAPAGGAGALVTLGRHAEKLTKVLQVMRPALTKLRNAAGEFTDVTKLVDKFIDLLNPLKRQKWCFIAGTPILTMAGPLPIEQIEPGMMVWSAPENGAGEACFRPVLETYRNRAPVVWHVSYNHDADPATPDETLGASAEHPFWVEETASFLPAADLRPGMTLRMAGGHGGTIGTIRHEQSHSPAGTPVFNFAVAEHHTYFAGIGGVWVHNSCINLDDYVLGKRDTLAENFRKAGHAGDIADDMALDEATALLRARKLDDPKTLTQTGATLFEKTPSIINGAVSGDVARVRKFLNDTGLGDVPNQPASLVRAGDGGQPFFATPKGRMPDDWAELAEQMRSAFGLVSPSAAWKVAEHSEALALKRAVDKLGPGVTEFDIATAGRHVCGHCVGDGGASGLAEIAMKLGLTKLKIRSEAGFQAGNYNNDSAVTIIIDQASKTWLIVRGIQ